MANAKQSYDLEKARKVREQYRLEKNRRSAATQNDLALPTVDATWLKDTSDGTLDGPRLLSGDDLGLTVPEWTSLPPDGRSNTLEVLWGKLSDPVDNYPVVDTVVVTAPIPAGTFPLSVKVPNLDLRPDGTYSLLYKVTSHNGMERRSPFVTLIADTIPPYDRFEPAALNLPISELTDEYLASNPGGLVGTVPHYPDRKPGDKIAFYWLTTPLPDKPENLPAPVGFTEVLDARQITFPKSVLERSLDKDHYALYVLLDKAGNRSSISGYKRIDVALGPLPDALQDPVVPLAADGLLDLADARLGIVVQILQFDNHKRTDRIEVTWGSVVLDTVEVGEVRVWPLEVQVPALALRDEYDRLLGGVQSTQVSYRVLRGHKPSEVKAIRVDVDFSTIGPDPNPDPDPDWPHPINPDLDQARVFGKNSNTLNTLKRADGGEDAELKFNLYEPLDAGEVVDFFWSGTEVTEAQYIVKSADLPGDEVTVSIPWSYIEAAGNQPQLPVTYRIHAADSDNYQSPETTLVEVDAITLTPDAPTFEGLRGEWLNCNSLFEVPNNPHPLEPAVRVRVPDLSKHLKAGDQVTLVWEAFDLISGDPLPTATKRETITLDASHPVSGFVWYVQPYVDHLLPTYDPPDNLDGRGVVHYEFMQDSETVYSDTAEALVGLFDAAGACPLP